MHETRRLLEAAAALSRLLSAGQVPHAFYGRVLTAVLSNNPQADEIFCIVEGGAAHPFRRVRQACAGSEDVTLVSSPWSNRLHVTYQRLIPPIDIEILVAGEDGPRRLDASKVVIVESLPFLTISEFIRAKLKTWAIRAAATDAQDIIFALNRYWNQVDINRIPEQEMNDFVKAHSTAGPGWTSLKRRYRIRS
ncbi:hypothetical protein CERSUDRAFT_86160 [Gelatoporia subvermispora B]|uniref:Uncharacterized protein n=1 Tax=Ceriporiopsis subvermispora (strain B) TaxID=914234 RepID=M2QCI7_CERS8|nr:hypothetical protein CERSUDRAFT_86160 [Gelatoporia subvermispora B]